jgi:CRISPR/Cas system-associated protein Cas10 (large subunit of type III CRISPR-Cas system)
MPDLAAMLLRKSIGSLSGGGQSCASCGRTPLAGERLHEMDSGRILCDLCLAALPEDKRRAVRSQRVHASDRHLAVVPKAA